MAGQVRSQLDEERKSAEEEPEEQGDNEDFRSMRVPPHANLVRGGWLPGRIRRAGGAARPAHLGRNRDLGLAGRAVVGFRHGRPCEA
jgi:hypothetical protein